MTNMELQRCIFMFLFLGFGNSQKPMMSSKSTVKSHYETKSEFAELRAMLKELIAENKRLQEQYKRQEQVWFALEQMCKALNQAPSESSSNDTLTLDRGQTDTAEKAKLNKTSASVGESDFRIQILSVTTKVLDPVQSKIIVEYSARVTPSVEWLAVLQHGPLFRTNGMTEYRAENRTYISSLILDYSIQTARYLALRVYNTPDYSGVIFNLSAVINSAGQTIDPIPMNIHNPQNPIGASSEGKYHFTLYGNYNKFKDVEAYFTGVNMSLSSPQMYEIYSAFDAINITVSNISNTQTKVTTDLGKAAENGGVLTLSFRKMPEEPGLLDYISYGRSFGVLSNKTSSVVPLGSVGVYPLPNITVLYPPYQSITCGAMGDPRPQIRLEKDTSTGLKELQQENSIIFDEWTVMKSFTVYANDSQVEGKYVCRNTAIYLKKSERGGHFTAVTELIVHEEVRIDTVETGLKMNSSKKIELKCQASGKPIPRLELRLFKEFGPDLALSSRFKVERSEINPTTAMLTVTVSPVDTDIVKVYCAAYNTDRYDSKTSLIQIFPDPPNDIYNWDLYNGLQTKQAETA